MYSLNTKHRMNKADEFSSVFIFRRIKHGQFLKIHYKPNGLSHSRIGLIVSKQVHKRANRRNYMKRVLRELFRTSSPGWLPHDIIIRTQKRFDHTSFEQIKTEFAYITKALRLAQSSGELIG